MSLDQSLSDEDIYWGPMTLKEVKRRIFGQANRILYTVSATNSHIDNENDSSIKLLQSHSEPNLLTKHKNSSENVSSENNIEDDSFVQLENMVEKLCVSPALADLKQTQELNNTFEVIEYILNNPPKDENKTESMSDTKLGDVKPVAITNTVGESPQKDWQIKKKSGSEPPNNTPMKNKNKANPEIVCKTPQNSKPKAVFKTPAQSLSKKPFPSPLTKTPGSSNAFQHIVSPVASYIKNTPSVALVKDSHQKKNMPCLSLIPKLKTNMPIKSCNKENNNFPPGAYKSATKIKVIDTQEQRLPYRHGAQVLPLQKPLVQTHNHRVLKPLQKNSVTQDDSVADLTVHQAELSVYTQK